MVFIFDWLAFGQKNFQSISFRSHSSPFSLSCHMTITFPTKAQSYCGSSTLSTLVYFRLFPRLFSKWSTIPFDLPLRSRFYLVFTRLPHSLTPSQLVASTILNNGPVPPISRINLYHLPSKSSHLKLYCF